MQALANAGVRPIHHDGVLFPNSGLLPVLISLGQRERLSLSSIHLLAVMDQQQSKHPAVLTLYTLYRSIASVQANSGYIAA